MGGSIRSTHTSSIMEVERFSMKVVSVLVGGNDRFAFSDQSGRHVHAGWVSKEQRMLIMKHTNPRTYLKHYHPLEIDTDMIRTICGLDLDAELMRAVTRQSLARCPSSPISDRQTKVAH